MALEMADKSTMVWVFSSIGNKDKTEPNHHSIFPPHSTKENEGT